MELLHSYLEQYHSLCKVDSKYLYRHLSRQWQYIMNDVSSIYYIQYISQSNCQYIHQIWIYIRMMGIYSMMMSTYLCQYCQLRDMSSQRDPLCTVDDNICKLIMWSISQYVYCRISKWVLSRCMWRISDLVMSRIWSRNQC